MSGHLIKPDPTRRNMMLGTTAWAAALGLGVNVGAASAARAGIFGNKVSAFDAVLLASRGAVAATFSDFAVQSPEGSTCTARLAYPLVIDRKLPVLVFCPDEGSSASHYDQLTGALAAQGYFVLAIDRRTLGPHSARGALTGDQQSEQRLRRFAEARFLLDTIDAAAAALGPKAAMVDTSKVGTFGHGDGAWLAVGLGGWDRSGAASTRTRDGRVYAVLGLFPSQHDSVVGVPAQRSPEGVSGMFIGDLTRLPVPARGSGLLGLGLPAQSNTFGGLIGAPGNAQSRRIIPEPQALGATIASAALFFNWTLRGNRDSKKELMALNGRRVDGLAGPLTLQKA